MWAPTHTGGVSVCGPHMSCECVFVVVAKLASVLLFLNIDVSKKQCTNLCPISTYVHQNNKDVISINASLVDYNLEGTAYWYYWTPSHRSNNFFHQKNLLHQNAIPSMIFSHFYLQRSATEQAHEVCLIRFRRTNILPNRVLAVEDHMRILYPHLFL